MFLLNEFEKLSNLLEKTLFSKLINNILGFRIVVFSYFLVVSVLMTNPGITSDKELSLYSICLTFIYLLISKESSKKK